MANNYIYIDEDINRQGNINDASPTPDYNKIYFDAVKAKKDQELEAEMAPYRTGYAGGAELEAQADAIQKKYRLPQSNVNFDGWKDGNGPGAHYMASNEVQILQAVANKRIGQYNQAISESRSKLEMATRQFMSDMNANYERDLKEYYDGVPDPNNPRKPKHTEKPERITMENVNEYMGQIKSTVLADITKDIDDPRVKEAVGRSFMNDMARVQTKVTNAQIKNEEKLYKSSYDDYGKSLLTKAKTDPSSRFQDLTEEYTNNIATGINTKMLTPDEGLSKIQEFNAAIKKEKYNQLKTALSPQDNVSPDQHAAKAQILLKDHIEQGVITPQEGENLYQESLSQSLVADSSKSLAAVTDSVKQTNAVKVQAVQLDVQTQTTIDAIKRGIVPSPATIANIYTNAPEITRKKLDQEISQAYTIGKFSTLSADQRKQLLDNPDLLSGVFYLNDSKDLDALRKQDDELNKAAKKDPVMMVMSQGLVDNITPIDYSSENALIVSLKNRALLADVVKAQTGIDNVGLTDEELDAVGKQYAYAGPAEKAKMVATTQAAFGKKADVLFKKMDEKGYQSLSLVGHYFESANKSTGIDIINGIELLKTNKDILPKDEVLNRQIQEADIPMPTYLDEVSIGGNPTTAQVKQKVLQSAKYIYASNLAKEGQLSSADYKDKDNKTVLPFNEDLWKRSMKQALNGGAIKVGVDYIESPYVGATEKDVKDFLATVTPEMVQHIPELAEIANRPEPNKTLESQAVDWWNNDKRSSLTRTLQDETTWISDGKGNYRLGRQVAVKSNSNSLLPTGHYFQPFMDKNTGRPVVVNLRKLMQGEKYSDYNNIPSLIPKSRDTLSTIASSEAAAREWSKIRESQLNRAPVKAPDFQMQGDGNPQSSPDFQMDGRDYTPNPTTEAPKSKKKK